MRLLSRSLRARERVWLDDIPPKPCCVCGKWRNMFCQRASIERAPLSRVSESLSMMIRAGKQTHMLCLAAPYGPFFRLVVFDFVRCLPLSPHLPVLFSKPPPPSHHRFPFVRWAENVPVYVGGQGGGGGGGGECWWQQCVMAGFSRYGS